MTKLGRRTFVAGSIGAVAASPVLATPAAAQDDFVACKIEDFAGQLGSRVTLRDSKGKISSVKLVEAEEGRQRTPRGFRQPISLVFQHSSDTPLAQDVYEVSHPVLGQSKLLAVPADHKHRFMEVMLA